MKLGAVLSGVALGVLSCLACYDPVPVHADFGNFVDSVDYIAGLSDDEVLALGSSAGGGYVAGAILGIYLCTKNPLQAGQKYSADSLTVVSGDYYSYRDGVTTLKFGTVLAHSGSNVPSSGGFTFAFSDDFELRTTTAGSIILSYDSSSSSNGRFRIAALDNNQNYVGQIWSDVKGYFSNVNIGTSFYGGNFALLPTSIPTLTYGSAIPCNSSNWNTRPALLKSGQTISLPSGDIDPVDPMVYINDVLRPYVEVNFPDYIYLLPEPPQPESQYATDDIVPGIPKDWTIINPELPTSPHLDLTIPEGDFQDIDPGDTFTGFASGVGFWWSMVNEILTTFHIKTLALALLAVAVAIFALYKIGG